jgi:hypothetical protein
MDSSAEKSEAAVVGIEAHESKKNTQEKAYHLVHTSCLHPTPSAPSCGVAAAPGSLDAYAANRGGGGKK